MKSIRRTLLLNVTVLLVLVLGTVSALVYRITSEAIEEKQRTARELVKVQFEDRRDEALLNQARAIAGDAQSQLDPVKFRQYYEIAAALSLDLPFGPNAHVLAPIWLAERLPGPLSFRLNWLLATETPSVTKTVTIAAPETFFDGVTVTLRLLPLPSRTTADSGINAAGEDTTCARTASCSTGVSMSSIVNGIGPVLPFMLTLRLAIAEMVGGVLPGVTVSKKDVPAKPPESVEAEMVILAVPV